MEIKLNLEIIRKRRSFADKLKRLLDRETFDTDTSLADALTEDEKGMARVIERKLGLIVEEIDDRTNDMSNEISKE